MTLMPELKTCVNCGHGVSSTATKCTQCHSEYPFGYECWICKQLVLEKDSIPKSLMIGLGLYHYPCADSVLPNFRPNCRVCDADLRKPGMDRFAALSFYYFELQHEVYGYPRKRSPCPFCGELAPLGRIETCDKCHFRIPESRPRELADSYGLKKLRYFHKSCAPPPPPPTPTTHSQSGCLGIASE